MNENTYIAIETLVTTAESFAGFTVQVAGGEQVSYLTGTKFDGPAPVVFAASISERANGTADLRAQFLASDGEQGTVTTFAELTDWIMSTK